MWVWVLIRDPDVGPGELGFLVSSNVTFRQVQGGRLGLRLDGGTRVGMELVLGPWEGWPRGLTLGQSTCVRRVLGLARFPSGGCLH